MSLLSHALLALGATLQPAPPAAPASPAEVVAESQDRAILARQLAARGAAGFAFGADTTRSQVVAAFGGREQPDNVWGMETVLLRGDKAVWYQDLWLSFDTEGRLTRALLRTHHDQRRTTRLTLYNALPVTRNRRWDQLDLSRMLTIADVTRAWGPPDDVFGSGLLQYDYELADGGHANIWFVGLCLVDSVRRLPPGAPLPRVCDGF